MIRGPAAGVSELVEELLDEEAAEDLFLMGSRSRNVDMVAGVIRWQE